MTKPEKFIVWGIPALFLIGGVWHFAFDFVPLTIIAMIAPANESVWEHMKMGLLPVIVWWVAYYFVKGKAHNIDKQAWFSAAMVAVIVTVTAMPFLFYFYRGALGIPMGTYYQSAGAFAFWADIVILLICNFCGQLLGLHLYRQSKGVSVAVSVSVMVGMVVLFAVLTFVQPQVPFWYDHVYGHFGIGTGHF